VISRPERKSLREPADQDGLRLLGRGDRRVAEEEEEAVPEGKHRDYADRNAWKRKAVPSAQKSFSRSG